jgi:hypothetical protein
VSCRLRSTDCARGPASRSNEVTDDEWTELEERSRTFGIRTPRPSNILTRSGSMLEMARRGLADMDDEDRGRALYGFFGVVVYGRSAVLVMHRLKTFDRPAFDAWFPPWGNELANDRLLIFFTELRDSLVHGIDPLIGLVLSSFGDRVPPKGSIVVDRPLPTTHRGATIADSSLENLCRLYLAFIAEMFESVAPVIWPIEDRWIEKWAAEFKR